MKKKLIAILLVFCLLAAVAAGLLLCNDGLRIAVREYIRYPECPAKPEPGKWYSLTADDARCADGSALRGRIRFGDPDKLMIYFLGGGVVLDDYSAAQPYSLAGAKAFYYDNDLNVSAKRLKTGIASDDPANPFREWTVLLIPYATGDFHAGNGGIHRGYANFASLMEKIRPRLGNPGQLLITGYSAGGFGAVMLAEDILAQFPECKNTVLCVDSALLINENWNEILRNRWQAPEHIAKRVQGDNLTMDHLLSLNRNYPQTKILFAGSLRDGGLAKFQSYIDGEAYETTPEGAQTYYRHLCQMVHRMQEKLSNTAFYLWDEGEGNAPTRHTVLYSPNFFAALSGGVSPAEWILRALSGEMSSCGLELLTY